MPSRPHNQRGARARRPVRGQAVLSLRPRERLADRRRRTKLRVAALALFVGVASVLGVGWLSHHERFVVADVHVSGVSALEPQIVEASFKSSLQDGKFHLFSRSNIFLYPRGEVAAHVKESLPRVKTVELSRESLLAQAVTVAIQERAAAYQWCSGGQETTATSSEEIIPKECYLMDTDGFVFAEHNGETTGYEFRGGLVTIESPVGQTFLRGRLPDMLGLLESLRAAGYEPLGATVENDTDFTIPLAQGFHLKISFGSDPADVVRNLELILASDALRDNASSLEYVDLRFGNKVYYQLK